MRMTSSTSVSRRLCPPIFPGCGSAVDVHKPRHSPVPHAMRPKRKGPERKAGSPASARRRHVCRSTDRHAPHPCSVPTGRVLHPHDPRLPGSTSCGPRGRPRADSVHDAFPARHAPLFPATSAHDQIRSANAIAVARRPSPESGAPWNPGISAPSSARQRPCAPRVSASPHTRTAWTSQPKPSVAEAPHGRAAKWTGPAWLAMCGTNTSPGARHNTACHDPRLTCGDEWWWRWECVGPACGVWSTQLVQRREANSGERVQGLARELEVHANSS